MAAKKTNSRFLIIPVDMAIPFRVRFNFEQRMRSPERRSINVYLSYDEFYHFGHILVSFVLSFIGGVEDKTRDMKIYTFASNQIHKWNHYFSVRRGNPSSNEMRNEFG